jgi:hypothetical protein
MSGEDDDLTDLLGPDPVAELPENLVEVAPPGYRPMGEAGRALLERSRSYPINRAAQKNRPELLLRCLQYANEMPVSADVARRIGRSYTTLKYWLQKSLEGKPGDGFDMVLGEDDENGTEDNTIRFHEAWDIALAAGVQRVEAAVIKRATGYDEVLTYKGQVQYQYDPDKRALSRLLDTPEFIPENYLLDQYGAPVPQTVFKMDPDLAMFILKQRMPTVYGPKSTVDVNVKQSGVLVVGVRAATSEDLNIQENEYRREGRPAVTFQDDDDEDNT